jgi:hypothetical protein
MAGATGGSDAAGTNGRAPAEPLADLGEPLAESGRKCVGRGFGLFAHQGRVEVALLLDQPPAGPHEGGGHHDRRRDESGQKRVWCAEHGKSAPF